jgi:protein-S-isoprenylcysteine O-methyltransferase Ste14
MRAGRGALVFAGLGALLFAFSLVVFLYYYLVVFGRAAAGGPAWPAVLVDAGLFTIFALHHSLMARTGMKGVVQRVVSIQLERSTYVWTASILFILVCVWWRPVPGELYRLTGTLALPGYLVQFAAVVLTIRGSAALGVMDLAGVSPLLEPLRAQQPIDKSLETSGLYGFVRHPLYFAWALFVFATPAMTMTRFVFATVSTLYLAAAIPFEERSLVAQFGEDYRRYRQAVRWRMVPGVY